MANKTKPRILPWLREQLDSGRLGATWIDEEHTRFFIPWKHGLRQDLQQEDFSIFQAWAEASGSYRPGIDEPDPATWKRNFRAALDRKQNLRMVSNHSRDQQNPHKIYEFLPENGEGCEAGQTAEHEDQEEAIQEILGALTLSTQQQQPQPFQGAFSPSSILEQPPQTPEPALSCNPLMPLFASGLHLISFLEGSHRSPQYTLWFCLGEPWPTESQLWTKKLVMVKVVPTALRALHEVAQAGGASSLEEEVDLHISSSLSLSLAPAHLHGYLQELAHSMQWESGAHC
ncbi:interferon regulatory factor 3 isoform X3 [Trichosurus vulpecula]|uniref:interferon regulatory factor 3 isoform X3 n=1 Tax=Trichosurus vulpecula TaxID=9337 RepID=UPI00186B1EB6|nr:interferon regulatory factor 3 isoform X3 [Trichosurus vulpecula]